jgi:outer membrane receptor protein involved in Fe transport
VKINKVTWAVLAALATVRASYAADDAAAPAPAPSSLDQITVTAQRSSENMQDVPITIQAFTGDTLQQLNVSTFSDLVKYTPNVTFATNGPGQGNIYIRGLSAGFAGNQSSATIAPFPNVALYLDDQSMQFPARNLDIYMVDMQRIEVLEGPQGTLFGGGAEAGAVRYITNKPELNVTGGNVQANYSLTSHGDPNTAANATFNLPLIDDTLALRTVIYSDHQGGYIDNVPSTFTRSNNDLGSFYTGIKPVNGLCPNGLPTSSGNCAVPNSPVGNNNDVARNNWNPTTYNGIRASALYKINDDWNVLLAQTFQNMEADGESVEYPIGSDGQKLSALQVTAFTPAFDKDHFSNTAWTVNGKFGDLNAVYTGGYTNRHVDQQQDYTNYSRSVGGWYYGCTGGSGLGAGKTPVCYSPVSSWRDQTQNKHLSNEFRLSTPDDWRLHAIGGLFLENFKIYDNMNFNYKTIPSCTPANLAVALAGGAPCLANVTTAPGSTASDPGERGDSTAFGEDAQRGYRQEALFGSVGYDIIQDILQLNVGTRYYHYSEYETGSQYSTGTNCLNVPNGQCNPGAKNIDAEGLRTTYHGFKSRANIVWHVTPDTMFYYTFSQGFRPGAFNRTVSAVAPGPDGPQFEKPHGYAPDSLTNNEIGWKSELFDNRLQLNGSLYHMNWNNVQLLFFNPEALGNTTFGVNGPNYAINGLELQFIGHVTDGLSIQGSSSWNHSRQKNSPCLVGNIPGVPAYGQCITQVVESGLGLQPFQNPFGAVGTVPAFAPSSEFNIRARYDWSFGNSKAFAMVGASHVGSMYNQPATYLSGDSETIPTTTLLRYEQPAYTTYDASIGMSRDNWTAALYGTNLSDSHASVFTSSAQFIKSEVPLRPRVIGLKFGYKF